MRPACFSVFIGCTEFGIWSKYNQIFQKSMKSTKWRWTSYGINRISWRLGGRHTQRLARRPFISACVSLQQQCGYCAIDLESLRTKQRQKRLFNLAASDNLHETGLFFRFRRLHRPLIWDSRGLHMFALGACKRRLPLPMRPFGPHGVCRAKSIGFDIGRGLHLTLSLSFVIWCPKNPSMHIKRLQSARPLAAMG